MDSLVEQLETIKAQFLTEHPELESFQKELDKILDKSDNRLQKALQLLKESRKRHSIELKIANGALDRHKKLLEDLHEEVKKIRSN